MSDYSLTVGELIERLQMHYKADDVIIAQWYTKDDLFIYSEEDADYLTAKVWKKVAKRANPDHIWQYANESIQDLISEVITKEIKKEKKRKANGKA